MQIYKGKKKVDSIIMMFLSKQKQQTEKKESKKMKRKTISKMKMKNGS